MFGSLRVHKYSESGLKSYWAEKYVPRPKPCLEKKSYKRNTRLSFKNLGGLFFVLLAGFSLALVAFIGEVYVHYIHGRTGTKKGKGLNRAKVTQSAPCRSVCNPIDPIQSKGLEQDQSPTSRPRSFSV